LRISFVSGAILALLRERGTESPDFPLETLLVSWYLGSHTFILELSMRLCDQERRRGGWLEVTL